MNFSRCLLYYEMKSRDVLKTELDPGLLRIRDIQHVQYRRSLEEYKLTTTKGIGLQIDKK